MEEFRSAYKRRGIKPLISEWNLTSYFLTLGVRILRSADLLAPQTMKEKNELMGYGVRLEKIRVIPGSVNVEQYKELPNPSLFRKTYSIDHGEKIVLFVGQPSLWKGVHHIMLAMEEVLKKVRNARLILVGPAVKKAYRQLSQFGSSFVGNRTMITGPLIGESLISAYSAADVLVLPSKEERFGTVVLEALASGLPVISTKVGVAPDIVVHGENGLFVEYGNVRQISEAILRVLLNENFKRETLRKRPFILETYSSQREVESYENAYCDITS
jgi:glycosyltransferase involved in cell wall biosynthesis